MLDSGAVARGTGIFLENLELYSQFLEGGDHRIHDAHRPGRRRTEDRAQLRAKQILARQAQPDPAFAEEFAYHLKYYVGRPSPLYFAPRLTEALVSPTRTVFPLSSVLDGWHDIHDVALSVPTMVSSKGIERVLDVPLDDSEIEKLKSSAATLRNTLQSLGF